jgi:hypothetical protein
MRKAVLLLFGALACWLATGGAAPVGALGVVPPNNPSVNIPASPPVASFSGNPCLPGFLAENNSVTCGNDALQAINAARAVEGVGPMTLPSNWFSLSIPEQLFVVTNLERVDRGLAPFTGILASLDADATTGALLGTDPPVVSGAADRAYGSNWSGNYVSPLVVDYEWMYDDGWGGSQAASQNFDCTSPNAAGCWGHRDNVLAQVPCPCYFGAAFIDPSTNGFTLSYADEFVIPATAEVEPMIFTWAADVVPYLPATTPNGLSIVSITRTADNGGYWLASSSGDVLAFGDAHNYGSLQGQHLNAPIRSMIATPDSKGYWLLGTDGGIFSFGDAGFFGSTGATPLNEPVVAMTPTTDGRGYWLVAADGGIFSFGDAAYLGSLPALGVHVSNVAGIVPTADGHGYWMVGSDGGVFSFGDASYVGSLPALDVHVGDVVGIVPTADGRGYWMVGSDGGVFSFGDASYVGSLPALGVAVRDIVGIAPNSSGNGYWMVGGDGGVFALGGVGYFGSAA